MKVAMQLAALSVILTLCLCFESHESHESYEDLFYEPSRANSFISPQRRGNNDLNYNSFNYRRLIKSVAERRSEICEDYNPCRVYAYRHGSQQAYERYFARQNPGNGRF